jgi:hypothetical protein
MDEFVIFNPGVSPNPFSDKIRKLTTTNIYLTVGIILTLSLTIYFAYQYYSLQEETGV